MSTPSALLLVTVWSSCVLLGGATTTVATPDVNNRLRIAQQAREKIFPMWKGALIGNGTSEPALDVWRNYENNARVFVDSVLRYLLPPIIQMATEVDISVQCKSSLFRLIFSIRQLHSWAIRMLDAMGKLPSGLLDGTMAELGAYEECLNIAVKEEEGPNAGKELFRGLYCTIEAQPPLPPTPEGIPAMMANAESVTAEGSFVRESARLAQFFYTVKFRLGVCVPSTCSARDVEEMAATGFSELRYLISVPRCESKSTRTVSPLQIGTLCVLAAVLVLLIVGTAFNILQLKGRRKESVADGTTKKTCLVDTLLIFSLKTNLSQLFKVRQTLNDLPVIHGLRLFSMCWVILANTYYWSKLQAFARVTSVKEGSKGVIFQIVMNAWVVVDTFFFLGGLLLAYWALKCTKETHGKFSYFWSLIHRLWRLTPPLLFGIALVWVEPLLGSGPMWYETVEIEAERCRRSWWASLLYISNWRGIDKMCLQHSWYLSADVQLHIVCLFVLIPLFRKPIIGLTLAFLMIIASSVFIGVLTVINHLPPTILYLTPDKEMMVKLMETIYWNPCSHMGSYVIGITLGYILVRNRRIAIPPVVQVLGWASAIGCNLVVLFGTVNWNNGYLPDTVVSAIYAATHRTAWALGLAWVTFICINGQGGIINRILSHKSLVPLSRLSYMAFLLQGHVIWLRTGLTRERQPVYHINMMCDFVSNIVFIFVLALVCHLVFEAPFIQIENLFWNNLGLKTKSTDLRKRNRLSRSVMELRTISVDNICHIATVNGSMARAPA